MSYEEFLDVEFFGKMWGSTPEYKMRLRPLNVLRPGFYNQHAMYGEHTYAIFHHRFEEINFHQTRLSLWNAKMMFIECTFERCIIDTDGYIFDGCSLINSDVVLSDCSFKQEFSNIKNFIGGGTLLFDVNLPKAMSSVTMSGSKIETLDIDDNLANFFYWGGFSFSDNSIYNIQFKLEDINNLNSGLYVIRNLAGNYYGDYHPITEESTILLETMVVNTKQDLDEISKVVKSWTDLIVL